MMLMESYFETSVTSDCDILEKPTRAETNQPISNKSLARSRPLFPYLKPLEAGTSPEI